MGDIINIDQVMGWLAGLWVWADTWVFSYAAAGQVALLVVLWPAARVAARKFDHHVTKAGEAVTLLERFDNYAEPLYAPTIALIFVWILIVAGQGTGLPVHVLDIASSLLLAWVLIRTFAGMVGSHRTARLVTIIGWSIAALDIVNLLDPLITLLDNAAVTMGATRLSLFDIIWGIASVFIFVWVALFISRLIEGRIRTIDEVNPSAQVLISKVIKIVLVTVALMVALNSVGIDLTALAVFSGALGVGLGFGLQKVVSNFISGIILLMDRSIKPGDVIETQGTYGSINALNARYTSVITRDGTEYLIPNEDMITQTVINWSHSHSNVRRKIPVMVSYESDVELALKLLIDIANANDRVLMNPPPSARLMAFGDNGVELQLRAWISDPQNGVRNVASELLLEIWKQFRVAGIEFPYPQRVVHFADKEIFKS
jgi:small-conductance mechanosensitive channel